MRHFIMLGLLPLASGAVLTDVGAEFESFIESPATAGFGNSGLALGLDPAAWAYNPATGADAGSGVLLKHTSAFDDNARVINDLLAASYRTGFGAVGLTVGRNGAGDIYFTSLPDTTRPPGSDNRPVVDSTVTASDWIGQASVAAKIKNLSLGTNVKIFYRDLVAAQAFGVGADLGVRYSFNWGLALGARIKNAFTSPLFWSTDSVDLLAPRAALGALQEFKLGKQKLRLALESEVSIKGVDSLETHIGPVFLRPRAGLEFCIMDIVSLRAGRSDFGWSVGAGGKLKGFFIDYAFRGHDRGLGGTHLVSAGYVF